MGKLFIFLQHIVPHHLLSRLVGKIAAAELSWIKKPFIRLFIRIFNVDMSESKQSEDDFKSFNEFFTRELTDGARPLPASADRIASPADGKVSACGRIEGNQVLQVKGQTYSLEKLLADSSPPYKDGSFITIYLSPSNYHRVHMPFTGKLIRMKYLPGRLFSVNETTVSGVDDLFAINERMVCEFETEFGPAAVIMVGAMIVAGIQPAWRSAPYPSRYREELPENVMFTQGEELGRFLLGSTAIVLTQAGVSFDLEEGDSVRVNADIGKL